MENNAAISSESRPGDRTVNIDALTGRRPDELSRMFDIGMARMEGASAADPFRAIGQFDRISRALRQITVLERELLGLRHVKRGVPKPVRPMSERLARGHDPMRLTRLSLNDLDRPLADPDRLTGYATGPLDQAVAGVRGLLGIPAPADDPFAPDAERKEAERKTVEHRHGERKSDTGPAEAKTKPNQTDLALKAVKLALRANPRKGGFRLPKKVRKATPMRRAVERHGQGPPG